MWVIAAAAIAACVVIVLYACQTVTVQIGPEPSADRATGIRATTSINRKDDKEEKK
jgi:hypothetical protein